MSRKCKYCNNGKVTRLENYADFHYNGDEPIIIEEDCEECGGTGDAEYFHDEEA